MDLQALIGKLSEAVRKHLASPSKATSGVLDTAFRALSNLHGSDYLPERINLLCEIAAGHYYAGLTVRSAIAPAEEALRLARQHGEPNLLRKALTYAANIHSDTSNLSRALEYNVEALDLANQICDPFAEAVAWNNIGTVLHYAGQYGDAAGAFERVIALAQDNEALAKMAFLAYSNLAVCCLFMEEFGKAIAACRKALSLNGDPTSPADALGHVVVENTYVRLLIELGALDSAEAHAATARRLAPMANSPRADIAASIAEGLVEVAAGTSDVGLTRLARALDQARGFAPALRDALIAIATASGWAGQHEQALAYHRELMLLIRRSQQDAALFHHAQYLRDLQSATTHTTIDVLERRDAALAGRLDGDVFAERIAMLERLAITAELRDDPTGEHPYRVGRMASELARRYGCDAETCSMIEVAARLHDIGKFSIQDAIFLKPSMLTPEERKIMQTHPHAGAALLAQSKVPQVQMAEDIALRHHEWWNGSGYPGGLRGEDIPLAARITALADVFDTLTHARPYKNAWPVSEALDEIRHLRGRQFDPDLTDIFLKLVPELQETHEDLDAYLAEAAQASQFIRARRKISDTLKQRAQR